MLRQLVAALLFVGLMAFTAGAAPAPPPTHVWEKVEITLRAEKAYANPYTEVEVWIDLKGPGFEKRCYGFWDGGGTFRVRVLATAPGEWSWKSGSAPADPGLAGKSGSFTAIAWTDMEKDENPCRRGMLKRSANGHAFEYAGGSAGTMTTRLAPSARRRASRITCGSAALRSSTASR
jgi:hypothetical protein